MFLVMDISNSYTKYAVAGTRTLGRVGRMPTADINAAWLRALRKRYPRRKLYLSSVVPQKMRLVQNVFRADCWALRGDKDLGFPVRYPRKKQIGADRLANAAAARQLCGWPVVVVDFGTAVTFDVVDKTGAYCGGVIAPGLNAMTDYLHEKTALLPRIRVVAPRRAIGKSTREAMLTGAVIGYRGLVREIIAEIKKEMRLRGRLKVVATGGQARLVARGLSLIHKVNPLLTLEGVRIIALYQRVKNG